MTSSDEGLRFSCFNNEDKSATLAALIASTVREDDPNHTLDQICEGILRSESVSGLDPLDIIPVLLPAKISAAKDIMSQIGECCSAKEVVIAVQEAVERLHNTLSAGSDDSDGEDNDLSPAAQLDTLISLYSSSIPRLKLRNKTATGTISPLLTDLESTIRLIPRHTAPAEGRDLISNISSTIQIIWKWARTSSTNNVEDVSTCKAVLQSLLDTTITACIFSVNSSLAEKAFKASFPRMVCRSAIKPGQEESDEVVETAKDASTALGFSLDALNSKPSLTSLVLLAHNPTFLVASLPWVSSFLPVLITSIQSNIALDETISVLFHQLTRATDLPPEIFGPLTSVLPSLASVHPDPQTRFLTFRLLAVLLTLVPSPVRFDILRDLTSSECEFPQMRAAAIALVKEAVLEGIDDRSPSETTTMPNLFGSPRFMQTFGPILFRPSPPDLLSLNLTVEEFKDSYEVSRLADSLALFYVLLLRDKRNRTGVRDSTAISTVKSTLLEPLRSFLASIRETTEDHHDHDHDDMTLVALEMNLERTELTLAALHTEGVITFNP